jgi:hypothetical protein
MGTVVAVDAGARSLTVEARHAEPWMESARANYSVGNLKFLREVKAGDQILGHVFEGETELRRVEIVAIAAPRQH